MSDQNARLESHERIIVDQYGGIAPVFEAFYIESLIYAAGRAAEAFNRFDQACGSGARHEEIVATVHEALTHAAAVSRFFWPARAGRIAPARAEKLRDAFGVTNDSALHDRELRNALEHYDERLDEFLLQDFAGYMFPGPLVGPATLADQPMGQIFRLVDPDAEVFVLLGKKHQFGEVRHSVEKIVIQAKEMKGQRGGLEPLGLRKAPPAGGT